MIRYACPHCQRVAESADALRGFTIICLGCRQPVRVPDESTVSAAAAPSLPPPPPAVERVLEEPPPVPPKPVVIPPAPAVSRRPAAPAPLQLKPAVAPPAGSAGRRRLLILAGTGALLALLLLVGGTIGPRWYGQRQERKRRAAEEQRVEDLKDAVRTNFTPAALKKLAAKHPTWDIAPADAPKIKGQLVVLSLTDPDKTKRPFWAELAARFPLELPESVDEGLVRDLFERGRADELTFELPEVRWAQGIGELDTVIGVRWRKEVAGVYFGDQFVEAGERLLGAENVRDLPQAQRWRATVVVLDLAPSRLTARRDFAGKLPTTKPTEKKKDVVGPRPLADVALWLRRLEAGVQPRKP